MKHLWLLLSFLLLIASLTIQCDINNTKVVTKTDTITDTVPDSIFIHDTILICDTILDTTINNIDTTIKIDTIINLDTIIKIDTTINVIDTIIKIDSIFIHDTIIKTDTFLTCEMINFKFTKLSTKNLNGKKNVFCNTYNLNSSHDRFGNDSCAFKFNDSNSYMDSNVGYVYSEYSISFWMKFDSFPGNDFELLQFESNRIRISWIAECRQLKVLTESESLFWAAFVKPEWIHVVYTRTLGKDCLYVNGREIIQRDNINICGRYELLKVGDFKNNKFKGLFDDLRIYTKPISATHVKHLYNMKE